MIDTEDNMNETVCPECGFRSTEDADVCPECGCPLSRTDNIAADSDSQNNVLQDEVNNDGCIIAWRKHCDRAAAPVKVFDMLDTVIGWCAIVFTAFAIVYLIVQGVRSDSDIELYEMYDSQAFPLILTIIILFSCEKISETVASCIEVYHTAQWLSSNHLDTSDCLELKRYGKTKKDSVFFSVHNIEVAYCGSHSEYVGTSIARTVGKCVLYVVATVLFGLFCMTVIEQYILDIENKYIFYGYLAGACAVEFLHWLFKRIIDKDLYSKVDEWRMRKN